MKRIENTRFYLHKEFRVVDSPHLGNEVTIDRELSFHLATVFLKVRRSKDGMLEKVWLIRRQTSEIAFHF